MSKASEWAGKGRRLRFTERLSNGDRRKKLEPLAFTVGQRGDLVVGRYEAATSDRLRPEEALRFARWILDTFGEDA